MWGGPKSNSKYSFVYILRDLNHPNRFKIGMSDDPDQRAKQEDWRLYGKKGRLAASIEVTADWNFLTPLGAHYVEAVNYSSASPPKLQRDRQAV